MDYVEQRKGNRIESNFPLAEKALGADALVSVSLRRAPKDRYSLPHAGAPAVPDVFGHAPSTQRGDPPRIMACRVPTSLPAQHDSRDTMAWIQG